VKAERDPQRVQAALDALTDGAKGNGNLLALSIDASRARATVGEISDALEAVADLMEPGRLEAAHRLIARLS
jgi:methylmalonyl-CoA mutase